MDAGQTVRKFPLVARARPVCAPLDKRVREISALAREAEREGRMALAAAAFNKAALLASDCDLPELARALCWRHSEAYLHTQPLGAQVARYGLEPLVNLARLLIRSSDGEAAYSLLDSTFQAVKSRSDTVIDGRTVSFEHITGSDENRRELHQWLWAVLLADGARALASEGRWADAFAQLKRHKGISKRMFDGRQVAVIAELTEDNAFGAMALLADTVPGEAWENAVTASLKVMSRRQAGLPVDRELAQMLHCYQQLDHRAELAVFHTRLGLFALDVADGVDEVVAHRVAADIIGQTAAAADGYAARDVLTHVGCAAFLTSAQAQELGHTMEACALGRGHIPAEMRADLMAALDISERVIRQALAATSEPSKSGLPQVTRS